MSYKKVKPIRNKELRLRWLIAKLETRGHRCQACRGRLNWPGGGIHHVVNFRRSDEATNFLLLCSDCHMATHENNHSDNPERLTLGMMCMVKFLEDPAEFDLSRLEQLRGQPIELEPLPEWLQEKRR